MGDLQVAQHGFQGGILEGLHGSVHPDLQYHLRFLRKLARPEIAEAGGSLGAGTSDQYSEEFYNRNKHFNSGALKAGSTLADPKVSVGKNYIAPERFQVKT